MTGLLSPQAQNSSFCRERIFRRAPRLGGVSGWSRGVRVRSSKAGLYAGTACAKEHYRRHIAGFSAPAVVKFSARICNVSADWLR
jgi:hypothetical protein